jgi:hypothetical protein
MMFALPRSHRSLSRGHMTSPGRVGVLALMALSYGAMAVPLAAQTSALAPTPRAQLPAAPAPVAQKVAIPERIDPIVTPLPVAQPSAAKAAARPDVRGVGRPAACQPGERLIRKSNICQAIAAVATPAKPVAAKIAASKTPPKTPVVKPSGAKPAVAKAATPKTPVAKAAKTTAKRG